MMSRLIVRRLRVFAIVAFCGVLSACCSLTNVDKAIAEGDEVWCSPSGDGGFECFRAEKGSKICPVEYNVAQCFFYEADTQLETKHQARVLLQALRDALELPIEELKKPRYADYSGNPNQGTLIDVFDNHYVPFALIRGYGRVSTGTDGFLPALKLPETIPAIKERIRAAEESMKSAAGD